MFLPRPDSAKQCSGYDHSIQCVVSSINIIVHTYLVRLSDRHAHLSSRSCLSTLICNI